MELKRANKAGYVLFENFQRILSTIDLIVLLMEKNSFLDTLVRLVVDKNAVAI